MAVWSQQCRALEAQRREILEMDWLIDDIDQNGTAQSAARAEQRPVPEFEGPAPEPGP